MGPSCQHLAASDSIAAGLCGQAELAGALSMAGDNPSAPQVYQASIDTCEGEFYRAALRLRTQFGGDPSSGVDHHSLPFCARLQQEYQTEIPWLPSGDLFVKINQKIEMVGLDLQRQGLVPGTPLFRRDLANKLYRWTRLPESEGGLGIQNDDRFQSLLDGSWREKDLGEIIKVKKVVCLEFAKLLRTLFLMAGIDSRFVRALDKEGNAIDHIAIEVFFDPNDPDNHVVIDARQNPEWVAQPKATGYQPITSRVALSYHHFNAVQRQPARVESWVGPKPASVAEAERIEKGHLLTGIRLNPDDPVGRRLYDRWKSWHKED
ncbi:MAG: hypothetical protein HYS22_05620 [Deltaproteobacteria bacterium]|nr:hypothetical protein [Deltaproteobacteria bacterium]